MKKTDTKIGYIVGTFPCKSETFIMREIRQMRELGFDISVLAAANHEYKEQCDGITILYKPSIFSFQALSSIFYLLKKYPFALPKLLILAARLMRTCPREAFSLISNIHTTSFFIRFLDKKEISHIHAHFLSWPSIIGLSISIAAARQFSISAHARDIFVEHGDIELKASHARFITTCTQEGLDYLKNNISEKYHSKLFLNYHIIKYDDTSFRAKKIVSSDSKNVIIAIGRLIPKKGFEYLIRAFALVLKQMPNCELVIVGEGSERKKIETLIKDLSIEQNTKLTGWQTNDATLIMVDQAAMLVVPSIVAKDGDRDGIPNVILEAFACRTPVIASKLKAIGEIVEHQKNGILTEPGNIQELAAAISRLLSDKNLQNRLAQEAYNTAVQHFNPIKNTKRLAGLLQSTN